MSKASSIAVVILLHLLMFLAARSVVGAVGATISIATTTTTAHAFPVAWSSRNARDRYLSQASPCRHRRCLRCCRGRPRWLLFLVAAPSFVVDVRVRVRVRVRWRSIDR